jgi:hypothetical protein
MFSKKHSKFIFIYIRRYYNLIFKRSILFGLSSDFTKNNKFVQLINPMDI